MEKINLSNLYKEAVAARIAAMKAKAKTFVETEAIPALVAAAKNCDFSLNLHVPTGIMVEDVAELIAEQIEYKTVTKEGRYLKYYWG